MSETTEAAAAVDTEALLAEIYGLLERFNTEGVEITAATDIAADLNVDSVAVMDLLMAIEDKYDILVPINELADVRTVGDLADTVRKTIESGSAHGSV